MSVEVPRKFATIGGMFSAVLYNGVDLGSLIHASLTLRGEAHIKRSTSEYEKMGQT